MYWCLQLSKEAQEKLLKIAKTFNLIPKGWTVYADHITLIHSSNKGFELANKLLSNFENHSVMFKLLGAGISGWAVAFKVSAATVNAVSHITIATAPDAKPVDSNYIEKWDKLYCDEDFYGTLKLKM